MNKLNKQNTVYGAIFIIALLCVSSFFIFNKDTPKSEQNLSYLEQFNGFKEGTSIQTTYLIDENTIIEKSSSIKGKIVQLNDDLPLTPPYRISYSIQNKEGSIDINVSRSNKKVRATFAGLEKSSTVSLNSNNGVESILTPVDWAGRIVLEAPSQTQNSHYCISIKQDQGTQEICHNGKRQVKS